MMTVKAAALPKSSALWAYHKPGDFMDCYRATGIPEDMRMEDAVRVSIAHMPRWVSILMDMRNRIVGPLGLKAGRHSRKKRAAEKLSTEESLVLEANAERIIFTVREKSSDEIILGEDDNHLNFRVAIYREGSTYYVATWVHPKRWYGWVYLYAILPFHKLIMRLSAARLKKAKTRPHGAANL